MKLKSTTKAPWGIIAAAIIATYIAVLLIQIVKRNYDLQHQLADLRQQIDLLQTEKEELSYKISYYQTDSYKEKEARAKLGLQLPGENVIILPKTTTPAASSQSSKATTKKSNLMQWQEFLFGH